MELIKFEHVKKLLLTRAKNAHKGSFGTLFSFCGCETMPGAAILSAKAAMRSGVGLVNLLTNKSAIPIIASNIPEIIYTPFLENEKGVLLKPNLNLIFNTLKKSSACLIGCGLGQSDFNKEIIYELIKTCKAPILLDADGINAVSENINILREKIGSIILTPHPGEMARLTNRSVPFINDNRVFIAKEFSLKYDVTTILKGSETIISSPKGKIFICPLGNPGMATAGSGDVLAGVVSSLLAQGLSPLGASSAGVFIHAMAGDFGAKKLSQTSMSASDIIESLPEVFSLFLK
ncbi:MAG: NAD(P)H-hydrate dehydratase [Clostridia bacterium]|nr:NAD(P)H-hydrate dehydratase [Clostridia bacterium]